MRTDGLISSAPALAEAEFEHEYILEIDASDEEEDATLAAHTLATIAGVLSMQHCRESASHLAIACASLAYTPSGLPRQCCVTLEGLHPHRFLIKCCVVPGPPPSQARSSSG